MPWDAFAWTVLFAMTGLVLMFLGVLIFDWITPFRLFEEISKGNLAVAWLTAGFLVSTGIIMRAALAHNEGLLQAGTYAVLGMLLNYAGYYVWEWATPKWSLNDAVRQGSVAAGVVLFGIFVAIGAVVSGAFS